MDKWNSRLESKRRTLTYRQIRDRMVKKLGDLAPTETTIGSWFRAGSSGPKRERWLEVYREIK